MNKKIILIASFLCSITYLTTAQTWQWGARGGSADAGFGGPDETVMDMATDPHGNIYVLSKVLQTSLNVDGHAITGYGGNDVLISSFKCDGTYRWSKDIGSNNTEYPVALKTDTIGGVYVTGSLNTDFTADYLSSDSTWMGNSYKTIFLLKYDTAGNYKWFRMPQADSITLMGIIANPYHFVYDMDVDGAGNVYMLCNLPPGAYAGGAFVITTQGCYIVKYNAAGDFVSYNAMQISGNTPVFMKRDHTLGRYYVTAASLATLSYGSTPIINLLNVGCFNSSGALLWAKQNTENYSGWFARPVIDAEHNIYLNGSTADIDTFNGFAIAGGGSTAVPFVVKIDTNGNNVWAKNATVTNATVSNAITLNGNEVEVAGRYPSELKWSGYSDSLNLPTGSGYHIFITRFNAATGAVLGMDSLASPAGVNNDATAMAADKFGNFYVGGDFAVSLTVAGTTLNSIGGGSDFFVAKYGTANCTGLISLETPVSATTEALHVYPNPATDELNITGVAQPATYRLLSITGAALLQGQLQPGSNTIATQLLTPGIYILEMTSTDGTRNIVRVVKE